MNVEIKIEYKNFLNVEFFYKDDKISYKEKTSIRLNDSFSSNHCFQEWYNLCSKNKDYFTGISILKPFLVNQNFENVMRNYDTHTLTFPFSECIEAFKKVRDAIAEISIYNDSLQIKNLEKEENNIKKELDKLKTRVKERELFIITKEDSE
jgi:vacuolar-type H+-ATPase catalytic subunit A/Vma1